MNKCIERLYNGIIKENPTLVLTLGMCPTLAVTTSAINGIGMGLSTTEIGELHRNDISLYDNGAYLFVPGRQDACFIPEDVYHILEDYLSKSEEKTYLFYNKRGNKINSMYFSRLMKKYTLLAGVPSYSAEALRNSCAYTMFAYHAKPEEVAQEMGVTETQIRRYKNLNYLNISSRETRNLVKIRVEPPS